jgi:hypothetical protein
MKGVNGADCYFKKAKNDFTEAIRLEPNNAFAYIERGEALFWEHPSD